MSNVIDGPAVAILAPSGGATTGVAATVPNPPPPLTILSVGSLLAGTVVDRDSHGHFLVQTDLGIIPLATRAALPLGALLTLQVRSSGQQLQFLITQIDGQPAYLKIAQAARPGAPTVPAQSPAPAAAADPLPAPSGPSSTSGPATGLAERGIPLGPESGSARVVSAAPTVQITGQLSRSVEIPEALARNNILRGVVLASRESGALRVRTAAAGTLTIASESTLEPGSNVALRIRSIGPPTILSITRESAAKAPSPLPPGMLAAPPAAPSTTPAAEARPQQGAPPIAASPAAARGVELNLGQTLRAIVQAPGATIAPSGHSIPAQPSNLPVGATITVRILPADPGGVTPGSSSAANPVAPIPPGASMPSSFTGTSAALLTTGILVGTSRLGQPLVQTTAGLLALDLRSPLPIGSRFNVEILTPAQIPLPVDSRPENIPLAHSWPALDELVRLASEIDLQAAVQGGSGLGVQLSNLAQPGPKLTSAVLFFLAALNGGDAGAWLNGLLKPQAREGLEGQGRRDLIGRLLQDFAQLGRLADLAGPDWRFLPIPLYDGSQIQQLRFFLRQPRQRGKGSRRGDSTEVTRFIVEVELTKIGDLQLDGLVKQNRFDLVLRTRASLPASMRRDIKEIFVGANQAAGLAGNVGFEASEDWFPMPLSSAATSGRSLLI